MEQVARAALIDALRDYAVYVNHPERFQRDQLLAALQRLVALAHVAVNPMRALRGAPEINLAEVVDDGRALAE